MHCQLTSSFPILLSEPIRSVVSDIDELPPPHRPSLSAVGSAAYRGRGCMSGPEAKVLPIFLAAREVGCGPQQRCRPAAAATAYWGTAVADRPVARRPIAPIGRGMGAALNTAGAGNAYVLSDRGTWIHFKNKGDLQILVEGDKRMFNQYGVMLVNPEKHPNVNKELGQRFIDYLVSPEGQKDIADYKIDGAQLFYPNADDAGA